MHAGVCSYDAYCYFLPSLYHLISVGGIKLVQLSWNWCVCIRGLINNCQRKLGSNCRPHPHPQVSVDSFSVILAAASLTGVLLSSEDLDQTALSSHCPGVPWDYGCCKNTYEFWRMQKVTGLFLNRKNRLILSIKNPLTGPIPSYCVV